MGLYIRRSDALQQRWDWEFVNLSTSRQVAEIGRLTPAKFPVFVRLLLSVLGRLLRRHYDLCYLTLTAGGRAFYRDALLAGLVRLFGIPIVYHLHNKGILTRQKKWLDDFLCRRVFGRGSVILLSRHLYPDVQRYVPPERVHYCPNGIPGARGAGHVLPVGKTPVEILFLSNLIEAKGVFVLLDACRILKDRGQAFLCRFVGAPCDITASRFAAQVRHRQLTEQVFYEGARYGPDKDQALARADIFTLPTYHASECFPLVVLEAMQFVLPVVSTYEGAIPDMVEEGRTGYLCPQRDAVALANRLEILLRDDRLRRRMGAAGYRKYRSEFTLATFENRLGGILAALVETGGVDRSNPVAQG